MHSNHISTQYMGSTITAKVVYDGEAVSVAYYELDPFDEKIAELGALLDEIERRYGRVIAVVPNIGLTSTSIFFGTSFQGVKGAAIIFRKEKEKL